ncbi:MAG: metal-sensitive transcriptional regulator [Halodesulfovibrio sp.]
MSHQKTWSRSSTPLARTARRRHEQRHSVAENGRNEPAGDNGCGPECPTEAMADAPEDSIMSESANASIDSGSIMDRMDREQERLRKNVLARMRRIEGQSRGIQRMIENGEECGDILMQVRAARSALHAASKQVMKRYMVRCHLDAIQNSEDPDEPIEKMIDLLTGYLD